VSEPDAILKAREFLEELDRARGRGFLMREAMQWAATSDHMHALLKACARYREALREIADRPEGSPVNDNRFAADVLKENEP
jgi:hypothetical protein